MNSKIAIFFTLFLCFLIINEVPAKYLKGRFISKRATPEEDKNSDKKGCQNDNPCGWAIYTPYSKKIEFFMKNACECEEPLKCVRVEEDVSITGFVYRCRTEAFMNRLMNNAQSAKAVKHELNTMQQQNFQD